MKTSLLVFAALFSPLAISAHEGPGPCDVEAGETECIAWTRLFEYPKEAGPERLEGKVGITVQIDLNGHAFGCKVVNSSGHAILDKAACEQFEKYAHFRPATDEGGKPIVGEFTTTITWKDPG